MMSLGCTRRVLPLAEGVLRERCGSLPEESPNQAGFLGLTRSMVSVSRDDAGSAADRIVLRIHDYPFWFYTPFIAGRKTGRDIIASMPYEVL